MTFLIFFKKNFQIFIGYDFGFSRENPKYRRSDIRVLTCPLLQLRSIVETSIKINSFLRVHRTLGHVFVCQSVKSVRPSEPCPCEMSIVSDISEVSKSNFLKQCAAVKTMRDDFNELNIGCHKCDMTISDC